MEFALLQETSQLEALGLEWNHLLTRSISNVPFLRHEYMSAWWKTRGGGEWPHARLQLVTARKDGELVGIAPLFLEGNRLLLLGSIEISDFLDVIAELSDLPAFVNGMLDFLSTPGIASENAAWRHLDWYNLIETSPTVLLLQAAAEKRGWVVRQEKLHPSPYIPLPGDFDTYLASIDKKQRHEIRRKMRRAADYDNSVNWYIVTDESSLEADTQAFLTLMANDPVKQQFLSHAMRVQVQDIAQAAFQSGWLQLAFMEVNGEKAAGYLNFDFNNRIWVYNSGIDRRFIEYSPGWVLLGHLLQWANENKRVEFDFLRGGEDYKYRFGAIDRFVVRVNVERR